MKMKKTILTILVLMTLVGIVGGSTRILNSGASFDQLNVTADSSNAAMVLRNSGLGVTLSLYPQADYPNKTGIHGSLYINTGGHAYRALYIRSDDDANMNNSLTKIESSNSAFDKSLTQWVQAGNAPIWEAYNSTTRVAYLHSNGTFFGTGFVDATPVFEGDAIAALKKHKAKNGMLDDANFDPFMITEWDIPITREVVVDYEDYKDEFGHVHKTKVKQTEVIGYTKKAGRNIGNSLTVTIDAINYLVDELCKKDDTYKFCE